MHDSSRACNSHPPSALSRWRHWNETSHETRSFPENWAPPPPVSGLVWLAPRGTVRSGTNFVDIVRANSITVSRLRRHEARSSHGETDPGSWHFPYFFLNGEVFATTGHGTMPYSERNSVNGKGRKNAKISQRGWKVAGYTTRRPPSTKCKYCIVSTYLSLTFRCRWDGLSASVFNFTQTLGMGWGKRRSVQPTVHQTGASIGNT